MNLIGAIGTFSLTDGTGVTDINEVVYGQNAVHHMMTAKSLPWTSVGMDICLNHSLVSDLLEDNPEFGSLDTGPSKEMYISLMANEMNVESALASVSIGTRKEKLVSR